MPFTTLADLAILRGKQPSGCGDRPTGNWTGDAMHPLRTTRLAARALAPLAGAAALASLLAAAGCGRSAAAIGAPVPASAIGRLTAIAHRTATINGDPRPAWITAVLTTRAKALTSATPGDYVPGSAHVKVFLITMRGHFYCQRSHRATGSQSTDRPVPVAGDRRQDLPGPGLRHPPQAAASRARQPWVGHLSHRPRPLNRSPRVTTFRDQPLDTPHVPRAAVLRGGRLGADQDKGCADLGMLCA